jgi:hypothetical protein
MKLTVSKRQILEIGKCFEDIKHLKASAGFIYGCAKNKQVIKAEFDALVEVLKPLEGQQEYEQKRIKLAGEFARKDADGKPLLINGDRYDILDMQGFNEKYEILKSEHKELVEKIEAKEKELESILSQKVELDFWEIKYEYLPDGLSGAHGEILFPFISEPQENKEDKKPT